MKPKLKEGFFMDFVKKFNPALFASVMGTGAVSIASYRYSQYLSLIHI